MTSSLNKISTLVEYQLPQFIRDEHPIFVEFLQKYYEFLEQPGNPVYELKKFENNYDVDDARDSMLAYFKNKVLPSFPDKTELSTERIIKASKDFYSKKGTPESFQFLFKALYNKDIDIYFPKLQILRASDGKWMLPQAFRLTLSPENELFDINLLEGRKAYGSLSRASCVIEAANRGLDKGTNREIIEIYISNVNRLFQNGEYLEVEYIDENGETQLFTEKIIGAISNIKINPKKRGSKYRTGDPVIINGGLDLTSNTRLKAIATVGNVTSGSIESVTLLNKGYGFRTFSNSLIDVYSNSGIGANLIISVVDTGNAQVIPYCTDSIIFKKDLLVGTNSYDFDNAAYARCYLTAGAGNTTTTVNLSTTNFTASSVTDYYKSMIITIIDGTGSQGTTYAGTSTVGSANWTLKWDGWSTGDVYRQGEFIGQDMNAWILNLTSNQLAINRIGADIPSFWYDLAPGLLVLGDNIPENTRVIDFYYTAGAIPAQDKYTIILSNPVTISGYTSGVTIDIYSVISSVYRSPAYHLSNIGIYGTPALWDLLSVGMTVTGADIQAGTTIQELGFDEYSEVYYIKLSKSVTASSQTTESITFDKQIPSVVACNTAVITAYNGTTKVATISPLAAVEGNVNVYSGSAVVEGNTSQSSLTYFTKLSVGKHITINGEPRIIATIANNFYLTVTSPFTNNANSQILYANSKFTVAPDATSKLILSSNSKTTIQKAFTYDNLSLSPIERVSVVNGGSFFEEEPVLNAISLYDNDYSQAQGVGFGSSGNYILVPVGDVVSYNPTLATVEFTATPSYSDEDNYYLGWKLHVEKEFRTIIAYDGATRTATLDRKFEKNVNAINLPTKDLYLNSRSNVMDIGRIAAVEILNGGIDYSSGDTVNFNGTGYGASATLTVDGAGTITAVNFSSISNRGEGYPIAPEVTVTSATGSGASLKAYLYGDGEEFDVATSSIGQIRDFNLISRGSDYITTPNVSLKIYDLYVDEISTSIQVLENDLVCQLDDAGDFTFKGTVDSHDYAQNITRVFNYSGTPRIDIPLYITRDAYQGEANSISVTTTIVRKKEVDIYNSVGDFVYTKKYPWRYGDGSARATAQFLNGLIKYNGYYINTDGHISSDKKIQDGERYHNYSYSLVSEVPYTTYAKSVLDIAHPAGAKLLPTFVKQNTFPVRDGITINYNKNILATNAYIHSCNVDYNSSTVVGATESFLFLGEIDDIIHINPANTLVNFTKIIKYIDDDNTMTIESPCVMVGEGRITTNAGNSHIVVTGNTNTLEEFINSPVDKLRINNFGLATANLIIGSGNTTTTINLNTVNYIANSNTNYYRGMTLKIVGGTGASASPNTSIITAYNGTTKIATLSPALGTAPDATSNVTISGEVYKTILDITDNIITLNSNVAIVNTGNNYMYEVVPKLQTVEYNIIKTGYIPS